ncbi:hypothetical protein [Microbacterium sp. W4I4]|nr:hypothetical protein [Microbacterium sp. W4I4]
MLDATSIIADVAVNAIPRPAFSNVTHTASPKLQPYSTKSGLPPAA